MEKPSKYNGEAINFLEELWIGKTKDLKKEYSSSTIEIVNMYVFARDCLKTNTEDKTSLRYAQNTFSSCVRFIRSIYLEERAKEIEFIGQQHSQTLYPKLQYEAAKTNYELLKKEER